MTEPQIMRRRNLLAAVQPTPAALPQEAIAAVAARNGFQPGFQPAGPPRRQRQPTGRDHQLNVRLRRDTLDFIYAQANERNIPVAQVIEESTDALRQRDLAGAGQGQ